MRRSYWLAGLIGLCGAAAGHAGQPGPAGPPASVQQAAQPAPWANKFFLPDIATRRDQPAPPVIVHDFGDVPHGTLCAHKFTITNVYDVPMQITEVRKSCTCLDYIPLVRVLQPNEAAEFTVTMNSAKFVGSNVQKFYVTFGPKFVSTAVIQVSANSRTDVTVNPGAVVFGTVAQGTRLTQAVAVKYSGRSRDWKLTEVVPPQGPFEVQLAETNRGGLIRGGAEYQVNVTLKPTAVPGPLTEQISLRTNDPANPVVQLTVTGTVVAPLELTPTRVRIEEIAVGQSATQRVLIRAAKPFRVLAVDGAGSGVTVELPPSGAPLPVQVLTVRFDPTAPGAVTRDLRIRTDLDGGATVSLPVEAEGVKAPAAPPTVKP